LRAQAQAIGRSGGAVYAIFRRRLFARGKQRPLVPGKHYCCAARAACGAEIWFAHKLALFIDAGGMHVRL
jgi:hypothetical protein